MMVFQIRMNWNTSDYKQLLLTGPLDRFAPQREEMFDEEIAVLWV